MASQVLSGSSNPTYTNNTGQNVRLLMNYIANCTSMTWAGVTVTGSSTVGKDVMTINGEIRAFTAPQNSFGDMGVDTNKAQAQFIPSALFVDESIHMTETPMIGPNVNNDVISTANAHYIPLSISPGGDFPSELVLASGQAFSAVSGAFNIVVIKEDGT